jgi:hypothetical protein
MTANNSSNYFSFSLKKTTISFIWIQTPSKSFKFCLSVTCFTCVRTFTISKNRNIPSSLEYVCNWNVGCWRVLDYTHVRTMLHTVIQCCNTYSRDQVDFRLPTHTQTNTHTHAHTAVAYSSHGYATSRLPSTSLAILPRENYCFHTCPLSAQALTSQTQAVFTYIS